jgi:hypothetical protein
MDFQIILLPQEDYWSWVRACKDYVMAYAISLTPDPNTAANFMAPRQSVTYPAVPNGYPDLGDPYAWFLAQHPQVRLDPIEVSNPDELYEELRIRGNPDRLAFNGGRSAFDGRRIIRRRPTVRRQPSDLQSLGL